MSRWWEDIATQWPQQEVTDMQHHEKFKGKSRFKEALMFPEAALCNSETFREIRLQESSGIVKAFKDNFVPVKIWIDAAMHFARILITHLYSRPLSWGWTYVKMFPFPKRHRHIFLFQEFIFLFHVLTSCYLKTSFSRDIPDSGGIWWTMHRFYKKMNNSKRGR